MAWLNYHHLLYFWTVGRLGSVTRACQELNLTQPAVSAQIRMLERSLGEKLFMKQGRNLVLTDVGRVVFRYADEIFLLGREMQETLAGGMHLKPQRLVVGVADQVPKTIVYRLLDDAVRAHAPIRLSVREDGLDRLLAELAMHSVDLVISDAPIGSTARVKAFNHLLGETDVTIYGTPALASQYRKRFPQSLDGAPMLMPPPHAQLFRSLNSWFDSIGIRPVIVGEIDDSALLKMFGQGGMGLFPAPTVVEDDVMKRYESRPVGRVESVKERFFAISVQRKITHPVVKEITSRAPATLAG